MDYLTPLTAIATTLFESIRKRIKYVVDFDENVRALAAALNELREKRDDLKREVELAEMNGLSCKSQVKGWLERVEEAEIEVGLIIEDAVGLERPRLGCFRMNCSSMYKKGKKVQKKLRHVNELKEKEFDGIHGRLSTGGGKEIPSKPSIGLDAMLEKVWNYTEEKEVGIIGIYGMGGVGKTTLLKKLNNELLNKVHHYDVVIWVTVSKDFVADKIQQTVIERLGLNWEITESQEQKASNIYRIMRRKRWLLLLDDIWEGLDLQNMGIPFPDSENQCKVIFTTRSLDTCSDMDAHRKLKVEFLGERESWLLFSQNFLGAEILESDSIKPHAMTIVRKCGGLPLALITIGRAMANKETVAEWRNAIEVLDTFPYELRGMENVFTLLKFSYDSLENDTLRSCFLYCALFPEDYSIDKEQLIDYWIGEGFLESFNDSNTHNKGHDVIGSLKISCLLETGEQEETQVKMHDVVRSFALWVASECGLNKNKYLVEASRGLNEAPKVEAWEGAHRISILDNEITVFSEIPVCPDLSTLLLQWNIGLNKISNGFFEFMPLLRVLNLSFTSLREIPESISRLVELHHLDLSRTKIVSLPKELGNLAKLRHLDLQRTHSLVTIPRKTISRLSQLRVLNCYYSYDDWEVNNRSNENEVGLAGLESLRNLTSLGITVTDLITLKRLSDSSRLLKCIEYLYIKECEGLINLEIPSTTSEKLRRLSINNCYGLKYLSVGAGVGKNWLRSLDVLVLHGLPNLETAWRGSMTEACMQNLRSVSIWNCDMLKNVSWVLQLQNLEVLYLFYCKEMEEVVKGSEKQVEEINAFPKLRILSIRDLPKLKSISRSTLTFPSLDRIAVIDCPKLKKLPMGGRNACKLPVVHGTKEWWDGLEWDEEAIKSAFPPYFIPT